MDSRPSCPLRISGARYYLPEELQRMPGRPPRPVRYLLSAGDTRRRDDCLLRLGADGGEEPEFADAHGHFVVLRLETEGAGHDAAPGVNLDDVGARHAAGVFVAHSMAAIQTGCARERSDV
jgi:hypothetical protein